MSSEDRPGVISRTAETAIKKLNGNEDRRLAAIKAAESSRRPLKYVESHVHRQDLVLTRLASGTLKTLFPGAARRAQSK